jgi:hypothetical protein
MPGVDCKSGRPSPGAPQQDRSNDLALRGWALERSFSFVSGKPEKPFRRYLLLLRLAWAYAAIGAGDVMEREMPPTLVSRASAVFVACVASIALAPPAVADPMDPIPGNGVFVVGPDIAPGLYRTAGSASTFGVWINNVPTQDSMCSWFTYSTPDANKDHVVQTNMSVGPMYANINTTIKAFESQNCQPWTRVP